MAKPGRALAVPCPGASPRGLEAAAEGCLGFPPVGKREFGFMLLGGGDSPKGSRSDVGTGLETGPPHDDICSLLPSVRDHVTHGKPFRSR